jgi:hypothetical protein
LVHYTGIEVCATKGYVCLVRLPSVLTQAMSGLLVAQPTCTPSAAIMTRPRLWRRRLFMRYRYARWRLSPPALDFRKSILAQQLLHPSATNIVSLRGGLSLCACKDAKNCCQLSIYC